MVADPILRQGSPQVCNDQRPDRNRGDVRCIPRGFQIPPLLVPADGYFEWTVGEDGKKDPWLLQLPEGRGFSFAGLWSYNDKVSIPKDAPAGVTSCTIITAPAAPHISHIHDRMPVILEENAYAAWLDPETPADELIRLLNDHHLDDQLVYHRVSRDVNTSKYDGTDTKMPILTPHDRQSCRRTYCTQSSDSR